MLFLGFETLRSGFQPLVSAPELVALFSGSATDGIAHAIAAAAAGALVTALLQGPGPAFVLVLGLTESTDTIGLHQSLTILAGVPLGVAIATSVVAWPFGGAVRRMAKGHLLLGTVSTLLLVLSVGFWAALTDKLVPGDPSAIGDGHSVLLPGLAVHLVVGFLLSQASLVCAIVLLLPRLGRWLEGSKARQRSESGARESSHATDKLVSALGNCRDALGSVRQIWQSGDRAKAGDCEHSLEQARSQLLDVLTAARSEATEQGNHRFSCTLSLLKAQDNLLTLQRLVERGVEWGVSAEPSELSSLDALHALVLEGLDALTGALQDQSTGDLNRAREREIWTNAEDNKARATLEKARQNLPLRYVQHWSAVSAAYEEVGNQLFRASDGLLGEDDDD
jgi:Na+/phosphate symporter